LGEGQKEIMGTKGGEIITAFKSLIEKHRKKTIGGSAALLVFLLACLTFRLLSPSPELQASGDASLDPEARTSDAGGKNNTGDVQMEPFYIELPANRMGGMARVTFSLTCDTAAGYRLKENETLVRDRLYDRLKEVAAGDENIKGQSLLINSEARKVLEDILRPTELRVALTGIEVI